MVNKERRKAFGFTPNPNAVDRLARMDNPLPPEGTPVDTTAILKQIQGTSPTLNRHPRSQRRHP